MTLTVADFELHARIGIPADLLEAAGVHRVTDAEARELLTSKHRGDLAGVAYPYLNPETGSPRTHRVRRDHPEMEGGRPRDKYLSAYGDAKRLYFAPDSRGSVGNATVTVVVVEAEKSVLAVTAAARRAGRSLLVVGTGGCWGWKGRIGKTEDANGARVDETGPLSDFDRVTWTQRDVVILFDANAAANPRVQSARRALAKEISGRGANVRIAELPVESGVNGPDDFVGKHDDAALFQLIDNAGAHGVKPRRLRLTPASAIKPRPVRWLWEQRIPSGALSLDGGREGVGKSLVAITLAAAVTRGQLDGSHKGVPRNVIIAATEDSWEHTIVPRLMAANADCGRVFRVDVATESGGAAISLPHDLVALEQAVADQEVALIVLDPLMSRLDAALDSHKDAEVRTALEPLVALADRTGCAILGLIHVNKTVSSDALTTLMGSRAFVAVARAVLFVMSDPDDDRRRLLGTVKSNLGSLNQPTLVFRVVEELVAETGEGPVRTGKLEWTDRETRSIREVLEEASAFAKDRTAWENARDWLIGFLTQSGGTAPSELVKQMGRAAGHSPDALKRARSKHGIRADSFGFPKRTHWTLPPVGGEVESNSRTHLSAPTAPTGETSQPESLPTGPAGAVGAVRAVGGVLPTNNPTSDETLNPRTTQGEPDAVRF